MPKTRRIMRTEPPWPPGLESLKKSFMGSRRYRVVPPVGSEWTMYDDALPVALAINAYLKEGTSFTMRVIGLEFTASVQIDKAADVTEAKMLLRALADKQPIDPERLHACESWQVQIMGLVEGVHFHHIAPMLTKQRRDATPKISSSWQTAFRTLQAANRR